MQNRASSIIRYSGYSASLWLSRAESIAERRRRRSLASRVVRGLSRARAALALWAVLFIPGSAIGEEAWWAAWQARVAATQAEQPHWITPLVTTTPRLEQEWRSDFVFQSQPHGVSTVNYGNGKGLELIPAEHIEVIFGVPPYFEHDNSQKSNGFGDVNFLVKYRLLAANEEQGNYILTVFFGTSAPTGDHDNSAREATYTPTIAGGIGWKGFDVQSTLGARLPGGDIDRLGTPILFNTAFQYLLAEHVWPEFEVNLTSSPNGDNAGNTEVFLTPGLLLGRLPIWGRLGVTLGSPRRNFAPLITTGSSPYAFRSDATGGRSTREGSAFDSTSRRIECRRANRESPALR